MVIYGYRRISVTYGCQILRASLPYMAIVTICWIYYSTNCHYAHIWSGSPQYLSPVHDRHPAIYVDDHIWKCTAGLVRAAIFKSEGVFTVRVFQKFKNTRKEIFQDLMFRESRRVFPSAYEDIQWLIWNF